MLMAGRERRATVPAADRAAGVEALMGAAPRPKERGSAVPVVVLTLPLLELPTLMPPDHLRRAFAAGGAASSWETTEAPSEEEGEAEGRRARPTPAAPWEEEEEEGAEADVGPIAMVASAAVAPAPKPMSRSSGYSVAATSRCMPGRPNKVGEWRPRLEREAPR